MVEYSATPRVPLHKRVIRALDCYMYASGPPHATAIFRICFGCYWLLYWLSYLPDIPLHFSIEGMAFPYFEQPIGPIKSTQDLIGLIAQPASPIAAWCLYATTMLLVVLVTIGWHARTALVLFLGLYGYFYFVQIHVRDTSFDRLLFVLTCLLAASRCEAVYSVRAWLMRRKGAQAIESIPLWPGRLIALQIAFMYFGAGVYKLQAEDWTKGEMLYYTLMGNWASPRAYWIVQNVSNLGFYDVAVVATVVMELYMPLLLFSRRWHKLAFVGGTIFHILIADLINIWPFMFMPLAYVFFMDPDRVRESCQSIGGYGG